MSLIGALPQGAFPFPSQASPQQSFIWGRGGSRRSPEDIALERKRAAGLIGNSLDFSPVDHWAQGLARLAQGFVGRGMEKDASKASAANAAESDALIAALMSPSASEVPVSGGGTNPAIAAGLRSTDPVVAALAKAQWERANPKPINNDTVADYGFIAQTLGKDQADMWLRRKGDPLINTSLPGGGLYSGPASDLGRVLGSGGPTPPATLPPDFKFDDGKGGPTPKASAPFR